MKIDEITEKYLTEQKGLGKSLKNKLYDLTSGGQSVRDLVQKSKDYSDEELKKHFDDWFPKGEPKMSSPSQVQYKIMKKLMRIRGL